MRASPRRVYADPGCPSSHTAAPLKEGVEEDLYGGLRGAVKDYYKYFKGYLK
jgi:hypothetical protein